MTRLAAFPERVARELLEMYHYLRRSGFAVDRGRVRGYRQPVSSGLQYFRLAEDAKPGATYAYTTNRADDDPGTELITVYNWAGLIDDAQAGYHALFGRVDGEWVFVQGPCITPCVHTGSLNLGSPPDGTVGEEYGGHTVTGTNVTGISISGLPPGLSATGGAISGTPTAAGTFIAIVTATAGDCTLTQSMPITINTAS